MKIFKFFKKLNIFKKLNFRNSVTLFTSGYNLERCLNGLCNKKIKFMSIEKENSKNAKIEISPIYENEVEVFLEGKNIKVIKKKYNGLLKVQKFLLSRFGILIGLFLVFCFYVISSNYVWNIEIFGNETHSTHEIIEILNQNGVNILDSLNEKTNDEIERIVFDNFDEVSMVSVIKKGITIIVNIKERLLNDENQNEGFSALVATSDGIITGIEHIQGTLLVKVGDIIRAGQELVAPYIIDSSGQQILIEPKSNIYADVWLSGESVHYDMRNIVKRTGNKITERRIEFLEKEIFSNDFNIPYENYETKIVETYLTETLIPIKYQIVNYYEVIYKTIEQNFSEVEATKISEAKNLARMRMKENEEIKSENYIITTACGKTTVSYVIVVSRKIS
ncbi:MAG: sporulation protein YqfD [Clostridia bacterium]|nr:sporulation protein YqfD [Clostridia bacterium]